MHKNIQKLFLIMLMLFTMQGISNAETLSFIQVSDVHYTIDNTELEKYLYFLSRSVKKQDPDFLIFLGDNVDKSSEEDVIGFMRAIHSIRTPYYIVLGKTDAHKLSGISKEIYLDIVTAFNRNQKDNSRYYYFKPNSDVICAVLDDNSDFAQSYHGEIPDEQVEWLRSLLTKYPKKLFIIFQHSPVLAPRDEYKYSLLNSDKYKELIKEFSNIITISSGHYHQSAVNTDENGVRHISAPAFKDMPHTFQYIEIEYDINTYKTPKDIQISVQELRV